MLNKNRDNPHTWHNHILILIGSVTFSQIMIYTYAYIHIFVYMCIIVFMIAFIQVINNSTFHSSSLSSLPYASIKTKITLVIDLSPFLHNDVMKNLLPSYHILFYTQYGLISNYIIFSNAGFN
jgi:hypothetical protein